MNLNERGAGTYPIVPIELPIDGWIPERCACAWAYDHKRRVKYIKFLHANCPVTRHRVAFDNSHIETPIVVTKLPEKKGRGRPKVESGQWHKKKAASA
jgi:hypothetical protein